jgi:hypothetical protein
MIQGSREDHMANNSSNNDCTFDDTSFDDHDYVEVAENKEKNIEFDDSKEGWEIKEPTVEEMVKIDEKSKKEIKEELFIPEFIPNSEDEGKIFLTDYELAQINLNAEKHKNFEHEKKIIDMRFQIIKTQQALLDAKKETLERDMMITEYHAIHNTKNMEEFKETSKQFLINISNKHKELKNKHWGYNPESGEIVVDE